MQLSSEINSSWPYAMTGPNAAPFLPVRGWQITLGLAALVLAFVPLVPPVDALEGGATSRGFIEFGLILTTLVLLAIYLKVQGAFSFDVKSPAFLIISAYCWWCMVSAIWSPNPILTIAKAGELWCITLAALMTVTLALRSNFSEARLATVFALAMIAVICGLIVANVFYWGKPLPSTGDSALAMELLGESFSEERPRLILAYQHALLTADLLALAIISLIASDLRKIFKAILLPGLLALLWLTDARGATIGLATSLLALALLKLGRNSTRAIAVMSSLSVAVAALLVFQDRLPALVRPFMTDDVLTLNSRTELWSKTITYIFAQPILGTGYFASRYLLIKDFDFAGHAHNSFLEVQLTTGLIGLLMLCAFLVLIAREIFATRHAWLLGVTLYCLIQGMVNPIFFTPVLAMFAVTLALTYAGLKKSSAGDPVGRVAQ
jgi:O-antigen ligase